MPQVVGIFPERWAPHWNMIYETLGESYHSEITQDTVIVFSVYLRYPISEIRQLYPGYRILVYQAEPLLSRYHYWNADNIINTISDADEIWDYDYQNCQLLRDRGLDAKFRPLLHANGIRSCSWTTPKDIDILIYGLFSERRGIWLHHLHMGVPPSVNVYSVCNVMHPDLDRLVDRAKIVVDWHQHPDQKQQAQTRLSFLLSNGKHVISEASDINYYGDLIEEFHSIPQMIDLINCRLDQYDAKNEQYLQQEFSKLTIQDFEQRAKGAT